ncbi:glycosyl hydrolase family 18 protein [Cellulomonas sp. URHE0023]|uniref:glycosyl hydrolase family 18 protein n=1 Tax=Cellulomonas sp. URHE0023 TaxID=1380354 RepID=UPI00048605FB|nr:glycosyl hydrolase family 18 protein [Cellulomonas sp. URHE0023]
MNRTIVVVTGALVALPLITTGAASAASPLPVEGYLMANDGAQQFVVRDAQALALVGVDGVNLNSKGSALTAVPSSAAPIVSAAHARGLKAELLVGNYDESIGDFSPGIATKLLSSSKNRSAVVSSLVSKVSSGGYDGVQVDLESLNSSHTAGLTTFISSLRSALPAGKSISMALMASDTANGYKAGGYDVTALSGSVNRFVLMAYDQHGPTWTEAGPIGGTPWVKSVLSAFIAAGAPKSKIDLGVAEYAYTWPGNGSDGEQLSVADARSRAGSAARYDATQQEWTAKLSDGTVIWWSDARTLTARESLAAQQGVHGLAVWELSLSDPIS